MTSHQTQIENGHGQALQIARSVAAPGQSTKVPSAMSLRVVGGALGLPDQVVAIEEVADGGAGTPEAHRDGAGKQAKHFFAPQEGWRWRASMSGCTMFLGVGVGADMTAVGSARPGGEAGPRA